MIRKNRKGKKVFKRTLTYNEVIKLAHDTFQELSNGKSVEKIFETYAIAKKHKEDYLEIAFKLFLFKFDGDLSTEEKIKIAEVFAKISKKYNFGTELGFLYCIEVNNRIKIGKANSFRNRMGNYKSHNGIRPEIHRVILVHDISKREKELLKEMKSKSEWFEKKQLEEILEIMDR
jgi:hypothetical protein